MGLKAADCTERQYVHRYLPITAGARLHAGEEAMCVDTSIIRWEPFINVTPVIPSAVLN